MPELGPQDKRFGRLRIFRKKIRGKDQYVRNRAFENEAGKQKVTLLGHGIEHIVVPHGKDKVAAIARDTLEQSGLTPEAQKVNFYTHKVLNILFPRNFPKFHAVFTHPLARTHMGEGTVRGRLEAEHAVGMDPEEDELSEDARAFHATLSEMEQYGLYVLRLLDTWGYNFYRQRKTQEIAYLDQVHESFIQTPEDIEKLMRYMEDHRYSKEDKKRAQAFAERIIELSGSA
jgi:hypothetical protein